jgi:tetratricopeptide (TPR) repeat protein
VASTSSCSRKAGASRWPAAGAIGLSVAALLLVRPGAGTAQERAPQGGERGRRTEQAEKGSWSTQLDLGRDELARGDSEAAEQAFRELLATATEPERRAEAELQLARALTAPGRGDAAAQLAEAEPLFRSAVSRLPESERAAAHNGWGVALLRAGRFEDAARVLAAAVDAPESSTDVSARARLLANLGAALERSGRTDDAFSRYLAAARLDPTLEPVHGALERLVAGVPEPARSAHGRTLVAAWIDLRRWDEAARALRSAWSSTAATGAPILSPSDVPALLAELISRAAVTPEDYRESWQRAFAQGPAGAAAETVQRMRWIDRALLDPELPVLVEPRRGREATAAWQISLEAPVQSAWGRLDTRLHPAFALLLGHAAEHHARAGDPRRAVARWALLWSAADDYGAAAYLASALRRHAAELDLDDRLFAELIEVLFELKGGAYRSQDWASIQRYHVLLGEIFQERGQWGSEHDPQSAIFQWQHAIDAQRRLGAGAPPAPDLQARLGYCFEAAGRRDEAAGAYLSAAEQWVELGRKQGAEAQLLRIDALGAAVAAPQRERLDRVRARASALATPNRAANLDPVELEVRAKLAADPALERGAVAAEVEDGVVTVEGVSDAKAAAVRRLVLATPGVKDVKVEAAAQRPPPR